MTRTLETPQWSGSQRTRVDALTGLRFVAAALVLVEHFPQMVPGLSVHAAGQGGAGVSVFFVLSGFVLTLNYGDRMANHPGSAVVRRFLVARVARIYPLHLMALAVVTVLVFALRNPLDEHGTASVAVGLLANALLLQSWLPLQVFHVWNGPAWSISDEIFFYLCFPVLIPWVVWPMLRRRWLGRTIVAIVVVQVVAFVVGALMVGTVLLDRGRDVEGTRLILVRLANFPPLRLGEFVAGCLVAAAFRPEHRNLGQPWRALGSVWVRTSVLVGVVIVFVAIQATPTCPSSACWPDNTSAAALIDLRLFVVYVPLAIATVAALAWGPSPIAGVLSTRPLIVLGEASYALYILQWIAWLIVNDESIGPPSQALAILAVLCTVVAALAVHRWIERPAQVWVLNRYDRSRFASDR